MKKLFFTAIIISVLSCNKNDDITHKVIVPPTMSKVEVSGQTVITGTNPTADTSVRPKITFTISIPDTASVRSLIVYQVGKFPYEISGQITQLSSGTVALIDKGIRYPPAAPVKYAAFFALADGNATKVDTFEVK